MAVMISEVYDAFRSVGTDEEKARKAAEAFATYTDDITEIKLRTMSVESEVKLLKWMVGFVMAVNISALLLLIRMAFD